MSDDTWKLKLRILRQQLRDDLGYPNLTDGLDVAIEAINEMLGEEEDD